MTWIKKLYQRYNAELFSGELSNEITVEFEVFDGEFRDCWGYADENIYINDEIPLDMISSVLIHEMIHIWQLNSDVVEHHGIDFIIKAKDIERKIGLNPMYPIPSLNTLTKDEQDSYRREA